MVAAKKPDTTLQALGLVHVANERRTCTPTLLAADALAIGHTLRAMAATAPKDAAEKMRHVGAQLVSAAMLALNGGAS